MKFKDLVKKIEEAVEIGKPETTKAYASMTPGQPDVVFTPPAEVDGVKIAAELDPAGDIKHNIKHALARKDKDEDGDVDAQDKHTPDEVTGDEKKNQTLHLLKKGAAERAHTKKGVAYESVEIDEAMTPQQKADFDRMMAGAMSRAAYNAKWKKPLKSDSKVIYGKNFKEEFISEDQKSEWERIQAMDKGSLLGGKEEVRKKLAYLNAVYAYRQKYKQDTLKVKKEIERINQSRIAEDLEEAADQGYWTVVYKDKNGKAGAEKNFDNEASAKKHAERGNSIDKVGGKYHVYHVKGRMDEQAPVAPTVDRKYIKGTPEWKAHKEKNKPINGHPTNQKESLEQIDESEEKTIARLKQLVRFGLMDKSKLPVLSRAISSLEKGNVTNPTERQVLFDLLNELIGVVTGDDAMFAKVRMSVQNEGHDSEDQ